MVSYATFDYRELCQVVSYGAWLRNEAGIASLGKLLSLAKRQEFCFVILECKASDPSATFLGLWIQSSVQFPANLHDSNILRHTT